MDQKTHSELELSLVKFKGIVRQLSGSCSIDEAFAAVQEANLTSIRLTRFYELESSREVSSEEEIPEEVRTYSRLIVSCLRKLLEMRGDPELNGQRYHTELIREQMQGRLILINRMYPARYQG